jgi:hypothetical protein
MTALTADAKLWEINTPEEYAKLNFPMCAGTKVYGNSIAVTDTNGNLINPAQPTSGSCWGLIDKQVDNTAGGNCALTADVNQGIFAVPYCSNDGFAQADVGARATAYVFDNITVTKTAGSLIKAGKVVAVAGIGQGVGLPAGYVAVAFGLAGSV